MAKKKTRATKKVKTPTSSHAHELPAEKLRWFCRPEDLGITTMENVKPAKEIIGQDRALRALNVDSVDDESEHVFRGIPCEARDSRPCQGRRGLASRRPAGSSRTSQQSTPGSSGIHRGNALVFFLLLVSHFPS